MEIAELVRLETEVWQALVDGDPRTDERLLADDFLGVYPTGFAVRSDHVDQLASGPTVRTFELLDVRMIELSESAALRAYRAVYTRAGDEQDPESMYVSSLWCRRNEQWVNVFSQDTPDTGRPVV